MAADAGAPFEVGRELDGLVQPMTLMFRMVGFGREAFAEYARAHPDQWRGVHGLWELVQRATEAGELELARDDVLLFDTPHPDELSVNVTRVQRVLGTNPWDLTRAELESRRQMRQVVAFLRKWVPGFEASYLVQSGVQVGVREIPQRVDGVVVAGRCISGTHAAHSSYRVMPVSMATGQAAGVCAALAAHKRRPPRDVRASEVQDELRRQGADLGP